ncbi:hypothetical protein BYT27DRAFT_7213538 [Phlegmacium glaucopus]|nr:hypothetical protein BYT27DRAFT_7213538 [Phlegmacium glaucopus]
MPAATAEKRVRQRANKLSRTESATIPVILPAQTREIISLPPQLANSIPITIPAQPLPLRNSPSPTLRYPLPTQNHQTQQQNFQLTLFDWKANVVIARERLQAEYEKDMQDATTKFAEHEKQICMQEFTCGVDEGEIRFEAKLALTTEALNTQYEEQIQRALTDIFECEQERRDEEYIHAFELGRAAGIQDESEYQAVVAQTTPLVVPSTSSATVSVQTEPLAPIFNATSQTEPPCDKYEAKVVINTSSRPFCELATIYDDASTQTTFPTCQHFEITAPTPNDMSHTPVMPENEISAGFSAKRERSPSVAISGSSTPALAVSEPLAPHAIVSAPEAAEIVQKHPET